MPNYGSDISCVFDVDPGMAEVSGRVCLLQALARRLSTPRGRLVDDPNYGFDLTDSINDDVGPAELARLKTGAEAECLKDERVIGITVTLDLLSSGVLVVSVVVSDEVGDFSAVLAVSDVSISILKGPTS